MSQKITQIVFLLLLCISFVSAVTIYAGEPVEIELEKPFDYYSVVGNSSMVELEIVQNGNNVTIIPSKYSQNDSYEIIFFDKEKETITIYKNSGGGTSTRWKTEYVDKNVTEYVDKNIEVIKEVPGKTIEVDKEINKGSGWLWFWAILSFALIIFITIKFIFSDR